MKAESKSAEAKRVNSIVSAYNVACAYAYTKQMQFFMVYFVLQVVLLNVLMAMIQRIDQSLSQGVKHLKQFGMNIFFQNNDHLI